MKVGWKIGGGGVARTGDTNLSDDELVICDALFPAWTALNLVLGGEFSEAFNLPYELANEDLLPEVVTKMERDRVLEKTAEGGRLGYLVALTAHGGELWERERQPVWEAYCRQVPHKNSNSGPTLKISGLSQELLEAYLNVGSDSGAFLPSDAAPEITIERGCWLVPWKRAAVVTLTIPLIERPRTKVDRELRESKRTWWRTVPELLRSHGMLESRGLPPPPPLLASNRGI